MEDDGVTGDLDGIPFKWSSDKEFKYIDLNGNVLRNEYPKSYLSNTRAAFISEETATSTEKYTYYKRYKVSADVLKFLKEWQEKLTDKLEDNTITLEEWEILLEVLRAFRNAAANRESQFWVTENLDINRFAPLLFEHMLKVDAHHMGVRVLIQFLYNVITVNPRGVFKFEAMVKKLALKCYELQIFEFEGSALMYQTWLHVEYYDLDLFTIMLNVYFEKHNEFLQFLFERLLKKKKFWKRIYPHIPIDQRLYFLQMAIHYQIKEGKFDSDPKLLKIARKTFLDAGDVIFQTKNAEGGMNEALEIAYLLEILSAASSETVWSDLFQKDDDLLIHCCMLLINIHRLGKESNNCFTPLNKLTDFRKEELAEHPAFCFKVDLIRLIANLTYKQGILKDLARNAEVIPVILDCCNIDAKNPLILQWSIIAIRNLCEENLDNQRLIAGLHRQGDVANELLTEMGIKLNDKGYYPMTVVPMKAFDKKQY